MHASLLLKANTSSSTRIIRTSSSLFRASVQSARSLHSTNTSKTSASSAAYSPRHTTPSFLQAARLSSDFRLGRPGATAAFALLLFSRAFASTSTALQATDLEYTPSFDLPTIGAMSPVPPVTLVTENLEKPLLDDRSYRVIRLANQVEVLLVHDENTDKSSAALDVRVGSMCDDEELPGQAHAVEHVLFMGTEKFPGENDYSSYLANHSGNSNAYTSSLSTNYYFEISHKNLYPGLDRFSQFFIAPLFDPNGLDRELNAVDSEHKKNIQQDVYRDYQLSKALSNQKHPWSKFSTGNLETLRDEPKSRGVDVRDRFMKFHERYYSGNLMKLTVLGRESLDQLEAWVVEFFSDIKNKDLPAPQFEGAPLTRAELLKQYWVKPVMETRSLTYTFPFLDEEQMFETQPSRYIGHLIGHEGPGSILAVLRDLGWATSLSAGQMKVCKGTGLFQVSLRLSVAGIEKIPEITALLFNYLHIITQAPPQKWVVEELMNMAEVEFRYKQKSNNAGSFASGMASTMQQTLPRESLLANHKIKRFDAKDISEGLSFLRPDNFRLAITTPTLPEGLEFDQKERWYGVEYTIQDIPASTLDMAKAAFAGKGVPGMDLTKATLHLPHPNPFIPTNFDVVRKDVPTIQKIPTLIRNTDDVKLWFKKDDTFWAPKANVFFTLRSPCVYSTPRDYAMSRMFCELVKDSLNEYSYDAEIAGLYYSLQPNMLGLDLELGGYNDKMAVLLAKVLQAMKDLEVKPGRWDVLKERLVRAFKNWELGTPYQMVPEFMRWLLAERKWLNEEVLAELEALDNIDTVRHWWNGLTRMGVEGLVHGNLYKEDALNLTNLVTKILQPQPLPRSQWFLRRCVLLNEGDNLTYERELRDPKNVNNAIEYMLHLGPSDDRLMKAKLALWAQITQERAFDQLRTKEQLGYVVFTGSLMQATTMGYRVLIQSERSCTYLESRIESFLLSDWTLTEEAFEKHQQSVLTRLSESMKNLNQESNRMWWHVGSEAYDFLQRDHDIDNISKLTREDMSEFYERYIKPGSKTRAKLSVHLKSVAKVTKSEDRAAAGDLIEHVYTALGQFFAQVPLPTPISADEIRSSFADVDITSPEPIAQRASELLASKGLHSDAVTSIVKKGMEAMQALLPQLEAAEAEKELNKDGQVSKTTYIEDVDMWRADQRLSKGPRPVRDLSEMEETTMKL